MLEQLQSENSFVSRRIVPNYNKAPIISVTYRSSHSPFRFTVNIVRILIFCLKLKLKLKHLLRMKQD